VLRVVIVLAAVLNAFMVAANVAIGSLLALLSTATVIGCLVVIVVQTRLIGTMRLRERDLNRPRMTPEDYRRLREMEIELGWEPSELPASVTAPVAPSCCACAEPSLVEVRAPESAAAAAVYCRDCGRRVRDHGRHPVRRPARIQGADSVWSTSGTGRGWCPACHQSMLEARGKVPSAVAAEHFAQLARVGRKSCISRCPICAERQ
jgi:hypothetical protein